MKEHNRFMNVLFLLLLHLQSALLLITTDDCYAVDNDPLC